MKLTKRGKYAVGAFAVLVMAGLLWSGQAMQDYCEKSSDSVRCLFIEQ